MHGTAPTHAESNAHLHRQVIGSHMGGGSMAIEPWESSISQAAGRRRRPLWCQRCVWQGASGECAQHTSENGDQHLPLTARHMATSLLSSPSGSASVLLSACAARHAAPHLCDATCSNIGASHLHQCHAMRLNLMRASEGREYDREHCEHEGMKTNQSCASIWSAALERLLY